MLESRDGRGKSTNTKNTKSSDTGTDRGIDSAISPPSSASAKDTSSTSNNNTSSDSDSGRKASDQLAPTSTSPAQSGQFTEDEEEKGAYAALRLVSDKEIEGYLERRNQKTKQQARDNVMHRPIHSSLSSSSLSSGGKETGMVEKIPRLDYSRTHVMTAFSPTSTPPSSPVKPGGVLLSPMSSPPSKITTAPGGISAAKREKEGTKQEEGAKELSAADKAMSLLSSPLHSYHPQPLHPQQKPLHFQQQPLHHSNKKHSLQPQFPSAPPLPSSSSTFSDSLKVSPFII
jgi:hypothetical protein